MATAFVTVSNWIINGAHHGDMGAVFCDPIFGGCQRIEVPYEALGGIIPGEPTVFYGEGWERRPNAELVKSGVMGLPQGYALDGNGFRPMTEVELHEAGLRVRRGLKVVDGKFVPMTPREKLDAGQATREEFEEAVGLENEAELQNRLAALMSPESMARAELCGEYARGRKAQLAALLAVRDRPEWPLDAEWPVSL